MKQEDLIKKMYEQAKIDTRSGADEAVLKKMKESFLDQSKDEPNEVEPSMWSNFMKSKLTKLAAAAVIVMAAGLVIHLFNKSASPAWALEQSIEAMEKYNAVHIEGISSEDGLERTFEIWATADENQVSSKNFRSEVEGYQIRVVKGDKSWDYDIKTNTVRICGGQGPAISPWIGSDLFRWLKDGVNGFIVKDWKVTYGKDPVTARQRAYVTCSHPVAYHSDAQPKGSPR